ncbi:MAG: Gfo/Idh/MocA family oxidoreductase [bacterium]|nr:Gfo/Idh/MocA family oxidoreductase [bacterium]
MKNSPPIPVAVIGVGRMGRHHARVYSELDEARLAAVVDDDAARAQASASEYGCETCTSVDELLERFPDLRAASIATPTVHHRSAAEALLERGVACLIEKPLAPSSVDARAIADLARARGVTVQVGHTERFNPVVRATAELGVRPLFIETQRVGPMSFRSIDVGVVFDLMIHDLDIVLMLARAPLVDVSAVGVSVLGTHEDVANARLVFEGGCVANLTASRLARKPERKLRAFADDAYVSIDYAAKAGVLLSAADHAEALASLRTRLAAGEDLSSLDYGSIVKPREIPIDEEEPLRAELAHFLAAVESGERPAVDAEAGHAAVEAAERVVASLRQHEIEGRAVEARGSWG